jgi:hypothetical protein
MASKYLVALVLFLAAIAAYAAIPSKSCATGHCVPTFCGRTSPGCGIGCSCQIGPDGITGFCG